MIDPVLQSFCERCGARFGPPAPAEPLEKPEAPTSVLGRFIRRTPEEEARAGPPSGGSVAEPLHFCLECRRYNCADCWNAQEGYCLSCRPLGAERSGTTGPTATRPEPQSPRSSSREPVTWPPDDRMPSDVPATQTRPGIDRNEGAPAPPVELDEWGRPRPAQPAGAQAASAQASPTADLPWTPATDPDPWRGVVFSAEETTAEGHSAAEARPERPGASAWPQADRRVARPVAEDWPESDRRSAASTDSRSTTIDTETPVPDLEPAVADAISLAPAELEPPVDAAGWARASGSVIGHGSLGAPAHVPEAEEVEAIDVTPEPVGVERSAMPIDETVAEVNPAERTQEQAEVVEPVEPDAGPLAADEPEPEPEPEPEHASALTGPELPPPVTPGPPLAPPPAMPHFEPPPPARVAAPSPLAVWPVPGEQGPFMQPYQPPTANSSPVVTPLPPIVSPPPQSPPQAAPPPPRPPAAMSAQPVAAPVPAPVRGSSTVPHQPVLPRPVGAAPTSTASHACANCGLPLSAKARFCRRCGAPQPG